MLHDPDFRTPPPDLIEDRKVAAAVAEYQRLIAVRDDEYRTLRALEDERARAVETDAQAYADALRADKDDPGEEATRRADAQILACRRRAEALAIAVTDAGKELATVVDRQRPSWAAKLETRAAEGRAELVAAVEALPAARDRLGETLALADWLADFPGRTRWPVTRFGHVPGLPRQSGDPYASDVVIAALRELARPPEPKAPADRPPLAAVPEAS